MAYPCALNVLMPIELLPKKIFMVILISFYIIYTFISISILCDIGIDCQVRHHRQHKVIINTRGINDFINTRGINDFINTRGINDIINTRGINDFINTRGSNYSINTRGITDFINTRGIDDFINTRCINISVESFGSHLT